YFCVKSQKGQQLNDREVEAISKKEIKGLLNAIVKQTGKSFKLSYNITGFISLYDYLNSTISKTEFSLLLENAFSNISSLASIYFSHKNLLLDLRNIFVNPSTKRILFIYIPIQYFDNEISLKEFYLSLAHNAVFLPDEDISYIKEYIAILNDGLNFSAFEFEEYIKRLTNKADTKSQDVKCANCGGKNPPNAKFCRLCGSVLNKEDEEKERFYDPLCDTGVLDSQPIHFPYLIRNKTQEKIPIDKTSFRLGKEKKYCDYFVPENNAVSRSHADIITREQHYYIVDNNSTNKTYVDGTAIEIKKEIEIFAGTKIRLANEDFVFYI
ncbi:MAG: DUF6382 domain-containing protein, partial [Oscillospiraceae bacterium]